MTLVELLLNRWLYRESKQNIETKDAVYDSSNVIPAAVPPVPAGGAAQDINVSNVTINGGQITPGSIPPTLLNIANWGWGQTCAFTSASSVQVNWGAGTFKSANGVSYAISAGNTGTMGAKNYIYFDLNVSPTSYQITTTPATAVGVGKVLIAVVQNSTPPNLATFNLAEATQIVGDNILANSINATKIVAGSIDATQISALYVYAGNITANQVTAGTLTGSIVQTAASGQRVMLDTSTKSIIFYDASGTYAGFLSGVSGALVTDREFVAGRGMSIDFNWSMKWGGNDVFMVVSTNTAQVQCYKNVVPSADNFYTCGSGGLRWSDLRSVLINGADYGFENNWYLTESYKLGIEEDGIALVDENDNLKLFIGKDGIHVKGGVVKNLDDLPYIKTPLDKRLNMDLHPELRKKVNPNFIEIPDYKKAKKGGASFT